MFDPEVGGSHALCRVITDHTEIGINFKKSARDSI